MRCTAVVLAGGASRRMGSDKKLLRLNGRSFLEHVVEAARAAGEEVMVAVATAAQAEEVMRLCDARVVLDSHPGAGPAMALLSASAQASHECILSMPVDCPLLKPELYRLLAAELEHSSACIPEALGRLQPLHGAYRRSALAGLERVRSMYQLAELLKARVLPESRVRSADPGLESFLNVNTPQDYRRILELCGASEAEVSGS
ncbi:MAG: molybdenum cofactor guanylyltransferase [Euryarchaeota archaeon]|nr:molybdenum cofactor guanylyltransferase [Euryarchaeota archaeon]